MLKTYNDSAIQYFVKPINAFIQWRQKRKSEVRSVFLLGWTMNE